MTKQLLTEDLKNSGKFCLSFDKNFKRKI